MLIDTEAGYRPRSANRPVVDLELLVEAGVCLSQLAGQPGAVDEAPQALARLRSRHPDHRLHLIPDEEAYDGSVHYNLLIRQADGLSLSLSVAAATGLPWTLRGVTRAREHDLLAVDGIRLSVLEALACIDALFDDRHLLRALVDACLIGQALEQQPVEVSRRDLQETADALRRAKKLHSAEATRAWLSERSLSEERFAQLVEHQAQMRGLRRRVVAGRVDKWFVTHLEEMGVVAGAWIEPPEGGGDASAALEKELRSDPLGAILTARRNGRRGGLVERAVRELSQGLAGLAAAPVGAVVPVDIEGPAIAVVLDRRPAVLDDATRELVERHLFDEWLAERRRVARVEWFWGNEARTKRATDA